MTSAPPPQGTEVPNPFPGSRPYREGEKQLFHGRDDTAKKLLRRLLAHPCVTLYGPSGSGKSSLMLAAVIPAMREENACRLVRVDGWPAEESPVAWLVRALHADLELGPETGNLDSPEGALAALDQAMAMAAQRSERPILIYLDQLEQLLFAGRSVDKARAFIDAADRLAHAQIRGLSLVLAMREDYLGIFRDRARGRRELLENGFRLGPLTVAEMTEAVCRVAGDSGQVWDRARTRKLMMDMRTPGQLESDDAEVQAVFGQIVCRALWDQRARHERRQDASAAQGSSWIRAPQEAPSTVMGVPLEVGERVVYFQPTGREAKVGWLVLSYLLIIVSVFGVCPLPRASTAGKIWNLLIIVCALALAFVYAVRRRRARVQADVVTTRRILVKGKLNEVSWLLLPGVASVQAKRSPYMGTAQKKVQDSLAIIDPAHWKGAVALIVTAKNGLAIEMSAARGAELSSLLTLAIATGGVGAAPSVAYEA